MEASIDWLYAPPDSLPRVWPKIVKDLRRFARWNDLSEDEIVQALQEGRAHLLLGRRAAQYQGFIVFSLHKETPYVWVAYSHNGLAGFDGFLQAMREQGFQTVQFATGRPALARQCLNRGWKPVRTIYELRLNDG